MIYGPIINKLMNNEGLKSITVFYNKKPIRNNNREWDFLCAYDRIEQGPNKYHYIKVFNLEVW